MDLVMLGRGAQRFGRGLGKLARGKPVHVRDIERDRLAGSTRKLLARHAKSVSAVTLAAKLPLAGLAVVPARNAHAL